MLAVGGLIAITMQVVSQDQICSCPRRMKQFEIKTIIVPISEIHIIFEGMVHHKFLCCISFCFSIFILLGAH